MSDTAEKTNIGRFACIEIGDGRGPCRVYGNVVDLVAGTNEPKRIRIQRGLPERHGDIVFPTQYNFLWWADEEED
jgi:hypothetical protein